MPTTYSTQGFLQLNGVSFTGTQFTAGSTVTWSSLSGEDPDLSIVDVDDDGRLDAQSDYLFEAGTNGTFTGYTISSSGVEYPIFTDGISYAIMLPVDGSSQTLFPIGPGASNDYQAETSDTGVFLCFGPGTLIATPLGEVAVEALQIGDRVTTADGRDVAVKWLGRQTLSKLFAGPHMQPVRIRAGALGAGLPHSDLTVTADHGMVIAPSNSEAIRKNRSDELVINASALVNGRSIDFVPMAELPDAYTVYHVETEDHDVILANGAPSETYLDMPGRAAFDNYVEYLDLYGVERNVPEMPRFRITTRRLLPDAIRARLGTVEDTAANDFEEYFRNTA